MRAHGADVRVARFAASDNVALAMFSGGGLAWADAAMKAGEFAVPPRRPARGPISAACRAGSRKFPASRGLILSLLVDAGGRRQPGGVPRRVEAIIRLMERNPDASGPVPRSCPRAPMAAAGLDLEARAQRRTGESLLWRKAKLLVWTLLYFLIMRFNIKVGRFSPKKYAREVVENSDFRKFDDTLRMVIDCTPALADEIERSRQPAAAAGTVRFGLHRQDKAMMTCFTPRRSTPTTCISSTARSAATPPPRRR